MWENNEYNGGSTANYRKPPEEKITYAEKDPEQTKHSGSSETYKQIFILE